VCSLCFERKEKLWGYVSIYNFYAAKTEFAPIAGGFRKELAYKNFPVCPDCAGKLKQLKPVIDQYFKFEFCGFDYFLIPEYVGGPSEKETMDLIVEIMVSQHSAQPGELLDTRLGSFTLGKRKTIVESDEKEVFDYLAETKNTAAYTMLFYAKNQEQFQLLSSVENIFPSQFKAIFAAKERAESHAIFKDMPGKKGEENYDLTFRFDLLKEFLPPKSEKKRDTAKSQKGDKGASDSKDSINVSVGVYPKAFLETTRSIFKQEPLSYSFLLRRIITFIRRIFTNEKETDRGYPTKMTTLKAFLILKFLYYLGCIKPEKHKVQKEVKVDARYEEFFTEHQDFFDTNAKKSVFMTGVLARHLLDIQSLNRGATPFRKRLNGLKLNPALINRIFTEAIEKLEQYDQNYYRELQSDIAQLMITGGLEELSNDEISYLFTLGMSLNKQFKTKKPEETENKE
jgi:CRISPR-associated protein Csh1